MTDPALCESTHAERPRILLVDDEETLLSAYRRVLRSLSAEIHVASSPSQGLTCLERQPFEVVVADYRMPGMNGDSFLELVHQRWPRTVRVLTTAFVDAEVLEEVIRRGRIFRFLSKPCEPDKLRATLEEALAYSQTLRESEQLSNKLQRDLKSFREIFLSALEPMMVAGLDGQIVEVNRAFVHAYGDRPEALRRRPTLLSTWTEAPEWASVQASLDEAGHWSGEVHALAEARHALLSISLVREDSGAPYALVALEKDVSVSVQLEEQSRAAQYEVILALAKLAEYRDPETGAHLERFRHYSEVLTRQLALNPRHTAAIDVRFREAIVASSPLHDIGKVGIPDAVLLKPGKLTVEEFRMMQLHTSIGAEVLAGAGRRLGDHMWLAMARNIAVQHHEKFDGTGYPMGLKGHDISLAARIAALADAYDAITSRRVYKPALPHEEARRRILDSRGSHFDPDIVDAFIAAEPEFKAIKDRFSDDGTAFEAEEQEPPHSLSAMFKRIERVLDSSRQRAA